MAVPPNLGVRTLSALVYAGVFLGSIVSGEFGFLAFFVFCLLGSWYEWSKLQGFRNDPIPLVTGGIILLILFFSSYLNQSEYTNLPLALLAIVPIMLMLFLELHAGLHLGKHWLASFSSGMLYLGLPALLLCKLVFINGTYQYDYLLGSIFLIWLNDSGAYFAGSMLGKNPVWPAVSPKKSWEGMIGGFLLCLPAAWFLNKLLAGGTRTDWIIIACIVSIFGPAGDFFESYFKRNAGVKDSGSILPGHGGFLDRLDSLLFSIPVLVFYLSFRQLIQ